MSRSGSLHLILKRVFLFKPYGDYDEEYVQDMQMETGLSSDQIKNWFIVMREATNLEKFWRIEDNEIVPNNVKQDIIVDVSKLDYLEGKSLEELMEEIMKCWENQTPFPPEVNIEPKPRSLQRRRKSGIDMFMFNNVKALNVEAPSFIPKFNAPQQPHIVNPWDQQQAQYPGYPYQYPDQPYMMDFQLQQLPLLPFQPQPLFPQYHEPQDVVDLVTIGRYLNSISSIQNQRGQHYFHLQPDLVQIKPEFLGINNEAQAPNKIKSIKSKPKTKRQPLKPKNHW